MRTGQKKDFARRLRGGLTDAERNLWHHLRNRSLMGWKFRRQHPVGPYIADFACVESKLIVELDGSQHLSDPRDAVRTSQLESHGYRVLRFWDNDALTNTEAVLAVIYDALAAVDGPCPDPSLDSVGGRMANTVCRTTNTEPT
ncbi:endonuclease domain-containing protein [Cognatiluteimonas profundi]|uniref:endonuclease domain-containing protein n=1 Tax=Cognatiluteimonas profundi TaxID=2594501 RepID=UPI00131E6A09